MASEKGSRKVKNQNIQVFVRVRPHTKRELELRPCTVIEVVNNREVVVQQTQHIKNFTFDRAFGPQAKQVEIYQEVVSPLIEEVLRGYNCTVLGYGQTGTGKTHTMVGESPGNNDTISNDSLAGIIPRALSQLFDELRASNTKHSVRVSFLELYNEELTDLLAPGGDNSKLRIYEDVTRKGTNIINGLKEITVSNKNEVYKIMAQGQERKRVAATLLNAQSSRSHTVFTIVVHMCENSSEGEELVKIGKLNLVDLAGSENISKAGSDNPGKRERARECANINQSLLTLSRVITALVARHPHVPYRESKLTRILQESLGGRTKTSLIATISPDHKDLEETISTLEYAHRAKNIQNQPEINQKMCEKVIVKEYLEVIDRLQRELQAAKNEMDTYDGITTEREELNNEIQELMLQKKSVEEKKDKVETMFRELNRTLEQKDCDLNLTKNKLSVVEDKLAKTTNMLVSSKLECSQQKHLVQAVSGTERELREQAQCILSAADVAALHVRCLHDTVDKRRNVESQNLQVTRSYREQASQLRSDMAADSKHFTATTVEELKELHTALQDFATITTTDLEAIKSKLEGLLQKKLETMDEVKKLTDLSHNKLVSGTESQRARVVAYVAGNDSAVKSAVHTLLCRAVTPLQIAQTRDVPENVAKFVQQWEQGTVAHVTSLCHVQQSFVARMQESTNSQIQTAYVQRNNIKTRKDLKDRLVQAWNQEVKEEKIALKKRYIEQLGDIEAERRNCQSRLEAWVEKERSAFERKRAAFEERLNNHVETEMAAIEQRLSKRLKDIEQDHCNQEARMASRLSLQEKTRQINAEEMQEMMQELQHWETARNDNSDTVKCYVKDFDEGTSAISTVTELYSSKVVEVLDHIYQEFIKAMQLSNQQTQEEAQALVSQVQSAGALFVENTSCALEDAVATNKKLGQEMMESIQTKTSTSSDSLKEVSASLGTLVSSTAASHSAHETSVLEITALLNQFEDNLNNAVTNLEEVQGRFLNEEYKVYSPIGKTPARCEIRYPRDLPTSSPHERILARFPNIQDYSPVQDSEVVESGSESRVNRNCESEDLTSLQPSPTPGPSILTQRHPSQPIVQKLRLSHDRQVHFED